jgi:hypothetical protein
MVVLGSQVFLSRHDLSSIPQSLCRSLIPTAPVFSSQSHQLHGHIISKGKKNPSHERNFFSTIFPAMEGKSFLPPLLVLPVCRPE